MYTLTHEGEKVGTTKLESGDPSALTVSGVFNNVGGAKALAGWIKSVGGAEDEQVVFIALDDKFELSDAEGNKLDFAEAHLITVPDDNEAYLDLSCKSEEDYQDKFSEHVSSLEGNQ